ncbi:unnamed protein product [Brugia pahangi]|uniref:G_PROTEIN_RECEP_F1_2 domain-containing protein n=1 Tax=Brugia pahangi TaxID=6280 RepID=A0A0N4TD15_BRUPA|nr:unnamed protein product [Brugia pahangi]
MVTYSYCIVALLLILPLNCNGANTTSIFDIRDEKYMTAKYTVVLLFPVFLLYGIISNILMAIVCFSRGNLYGRAFILITLQIIICNLISFIPHMIVLLPEILLTKKNSNCNLQNVDQSVVLDDQYIFILRRITLWIFMDAKSLPVYYFPEIQCTIRINKAVFSNHFRMVNSFWYVKNDCFVLYGDYRLFWKQKFVVEDFII